MGCRSTFVFGEHSVKEDLLMNMNKVLISLLHIKLGDDEFCEGVG